LSNDEDGTPPPLEPMRERTATAARTSPSAATERTPLPFLRGAPRPPLYLPSPRALGIGSDSDGGLPPLKSFSDSPSDDSNGGAPPLELARDAHSVGCGVTE
jgi:hypothetical protein